MMVRLARRTGMSGSGRESIWVNSEFVFSLKQHEDEPNRTQVTREDGGHIVVEGAPHHIAELLNEGRDYFPQ